MLRSCEKQVDKEEHTKIVGWYKSRGMQICRSAKSIECKKYVDGEIRAHQNITQGKPA